ncbi:hypothetical protein QJS10_CPB12g01277 [Acorus calamus]|uniref:Uncharacterized protein n=1 Tax=Acorus calamus TaxID=4465 RepID=A0AAV9DJU7_ACOCL|nr:hypothetical protein QJS10_CPB12g01277 [Acorus calamus]
MGSHAASSPSNVAFVKEIHYHPSFSFLFPTFRAKCWLGLRKMAGFGGFPVADRIPHFLMIPRTTLHQIDTLDIGSCGAGLMRGLGACIS